MCKLVLGLLCHTITWSNGVEHLGYGILPETEVHDEAEHEFNPFVGLD